MTKLRAAKTILGHDLFYVKGGIIYTDDNDEPVSDAIQAQIEAEGIALALPVAADIKAEAQRRILSIAPEWKQRNLIAFGVEAIRDYGADVSAWPADLQAMNVAAQAIWDAIKAIRTKSDEIEAMEPIPDDFADDSYWSE